MTTLHDFITEHREAITEQVKTNYPPLYQPNPATNTGLPDKLRSPIGAQEDAIRAITYSMQTQRGSIVVGEMGTGKTYMGIAASHEFGAKRNLVLCPPQMVKKWKREVELTIKDSKAVIVRRVEDLRKLKSIEHKGPLWVVMSREQAKLGYNWHPSYIKSFPYQAESLDRVICDDSNNENHVHRWVRHHSEPHRWECISTHPNNTGHTGTTNFVFRCPACHAQIVDAKGLPLAEATIMRRKLTCSECSEQMWQGFRAGTTDPVTRGELHKRGIPATAARARFPLAEYVKNYYSKWFDLLIIDEVHEYKERDSAQGIAASTLANACKKTLSLSGTLMGGYSRTLFHLLYRFSPEIRAHFDYNGEAEWVRKYGFLEHISKKKEDDITDESGMISRRKLHGRRIVERPGITPNALFHLIGNTAFIRLPDVADNLPQYTEHVELLDLDATDQPSAGYSQSSQYHEVASKLGDLTKKLLANGSKKLLATYLQTLLCLPETCINGETVTWEDPVTQEPAIIVQVPPLDSTQIYPKEQRLIDLITGEKRRGRKVLIYATHTNTRDITVRMHDLLQKEGFHGTIMRSGQVATDKREEWLQKQVEQDVNYIICHPQLVQTGLDLIDFPTIVWYETDYSVYTVRQASRRSWRIGQDQPVDIYYFAYKDTLQANALQLIAKKMQTSLAVEGELTGGALSDQSDDEDDIILALAKSLVEKNLVNEDDINIDLTAAEKAEQESNKFILEQELYQPGSDGALPILPPTPEPPAIEPEPTIDFDWEGYAKEDKAKRAQRKQIATGNTLFDWAASQT